MLFEILKAIFLGIVEGLTEFLPVSSTGHLILAEQIAKFDNAAFRTMFDYVIQLGAIMAVVVLFWDKLWPFNFKKPREQRNQTWSMWFKVIVAVLPSVIIGLALNDWMDAHLMNPYVVATTLIIYGIAFIWIERRNAAHERFAHLQSNYNTIQTIDALSFKTAFLIGLFQVLSIVPGTSRSGATILGGMLLGTSRYVASEFTFFLAIPTMFGVSILKIFSFLKDGNTFTSEQIIVLLTGTLVAFVVAMIAIKFMLRYIQKNSFAAFGWYRIAVGILVLVLGALGFIHV
ncbi:MAG TPA: undecaprenyl-diphosphate phosphatase [Lactobacillaceae bacterium]|jgi:undecaprenyl-diphosphatase